MTLVKFEPPAPKKGKRYVMVGSQELRLPGLTVKPGAGEFVADLESEREEFLVRVGAIRAKE